MKSELSKRLSGGGCGLAGMSLIRPWVCSVGDGGGGLLVGGGVEGGVTRFFFSGGTPGNLLLLVRLAALIFSLSTPNITFFLMGGKMASIGISSPVIKEHTLIHTK
jgi:hypothetical protein